MNKRKNSRLRTAFWFMLILASVHLSGCGAGEVEEGGSVSIQKDGSISVSITESFDKSYYDKDELQKKILTEAADYNRQTGTGSITVNKVSVEKDMALVEMSYGKAEDYAAFNDSVFFVGTPAQAEEKGYDLNTVLSGTKDAMETVGITDIRTMSEYTILITGGKEPVTLNGKAAYVSSNVTVSKNLKKVSFDKASEELAFVLYKQ